MTMITGRNADGSYYALCRCQAGRFISEGWSRREAKARAIAAVKAASMQH